MFRSSKRSTKKSSPSKSPKSQKSQKSPKSTLAKTLDLQGAAFGGLKLDAKGHQVLHDYVVACCSKLVATLTLLAQHSNKGSIDGKDTSYLQQLSKLFLSLQPVEGAKIRKPWLASQSSSSKQSGGSSAATTLPIQYFSPEFGPGNYIGGTDMASHIMQASEGLVRPTLPASIADVPMPNVQGELTGGSGQTSTAALERLYISSHALSEILASPQIPKHLPFKADAELSLRTFLTYNLWNLWIRIKAERRRNVVRRGAPVSVTLVRTAVQNTPFIIPV